VEEVVQAVSVIKNALVEISQITKKSSEEVMFAAATKNLMLVTVKVINARSKQASDDSEGEIHVAAEWYNKTMFNYLEFAKKTLTPVPIEARGAKRPSRTHNKAVHMSSEISAGTEVNSGPSSPNLGNPSPQKPLNSSESRQEQHLSRPPQKTQQPQPPQPLEFNAEMRSELELTKGRTRSMKQPTTSSISQTPQYERKGNIHPDNSWIKTPPPKSQTLDTLAQSCPVPVPAPHIRYVRLSNQMQSQPQVDKKIKPNAVPRVNQEMPQRSLPHSKSIQSPPNGVVKKEKVPATDGKSWQSSKKPLSKKAEAEMDAILAMLDF